MKTIYLNLVFILLLIFSSAFSQNKNGNRLHSAGHDTLLIDGDESVVTIPTNRADDCKMLVTYASSGVEGTYYKTDIYKICGNNWDTSVTEVKGQLEANNVLKPGDEITTGPGSFLQIDFPDGNQIKVGPKSVVKITGDFCEHKTLIEQIKGEIWHSVQKLLGSQKYEVQMEKSLHDVRGTKFSTEITNGEEIIRVYEGTVDVKSKGKDLHIENDAKEFEQLTKDYQAGKITLEEYMQKSQEHTKNLNKQGEVMQLVTCEAGFMVRVTDRISDPVPIESTGTNWFDDVNFKK